jgi:hypothetical protein
VTGPAGVGVRTVTLGGLPLLLAVVSTGAGADALLAAVADGGLAPVPGLSGVDLPRGARVGFVVDRDQLRLVDERDTTLLRAPRSGLDATWLDTALRLRGTMAVVARDVEVDASSSVPELVARIDAAGADGRVLGAIVGIVEERPTLPLLLG